MKSKKRSLFWLIFVGSILVLLGMWLMYVPFVWKQREDTGNAHTLHINLSRYPVTLDPRKTCDYISQSMEFLLYEGLMRFGQDDALLPGIAERHELSSGACRYTFYLRKAKWSDGSEVTAYDFERTWKEVLSPEFPSQSSHLFYSIVNAKECKQGKLPLDELGVRALDAYRLQVDLTHPTPYFLELTAFPALFPTSQKMGMQLDEIVNNTPQNLITNGPFILKDYKMASHYTLVKNDNYWDASEISLETIDASLIPDDNTAFNLYRTGKLDIIGLTFSRVPKDAISSLKEKKEINLFPVGATSLLQFNTIRRPYNNSNFRKALAYAIDRKAICQHVTQLDEQVADSIVINLRNTHRPIPLKYDPNEARALLKKALSEEGLTLEELKPIEYLYTPSDQSTRLVLAIKEQVKEVLGIDLAPRGEDFHVFLNKLRHKDFDISHTGWILQFNDPINMLDRFRTAHEPTNDTSWEDDRYRHLLEIADVTTDQKKRFDLMKAAESIFIDQMPQIPLYFWNYAYLKQPGIENIIITPIGCVSLARTRKTLLPHFKSSSKILPPTEASDSKEVRI